MTTTASDRPGPSELLPAHLEACLNLVPDFVRDLLVQWPGQLVLAGGFVRAVVAGEKPRDVDVFAPSGEVAQEAARQVSEGELADGKLRASKNSITVPAGSLPVQLIYRWPFDEPEQVIERFDLTIAAAAVWSDGSGWRSAVGPRFYKDLEARRLVYLSPVREEDAGGSLLRVLKFYRRGYKISLGSLGRVVARLISAAPARIAGGTEAEMATRLENLLYAVGNDSDVDDPGDPTCLPYGGAAEDAGK